MKPPPLSPQALLLLSRLPTTIVLPKVQQPETSEGCIRAAMHMLARAGLATVRHAGAVPVRSTRYRIALTEAGARTRMALQKGSP